MVARTQVLGLYRRLLREASHIDNYNFRSHAMRKVRVEFRQNSGLSGVALEQKFGWGTEQLEVIRRQRVVSQLYPEGANISESSQ